MTCCSVDGHITLVIIARLSNSAVVSVSACARSCFPRARKVPNRECGTEHQFPKGLARNRIVWDRHTQKTDEPVYLSNGANSPTHSFSLRMTDSVDVRVSR